MTPVQICSGSARHTVFINWCMAAATPKMFQRWETWKVAPSAGKSAQDLESIANASWSSDPIFGADVGGSLAAVKVGSQVGISRCFTIIFVFIGPLN